MASNRSSCVGAGESTIITTDTTLAVDEDPFADENGVPDVEEAAVGAVVVGEPPSSARVMIGGDGPAQGAIADRGETEAGDDDDDGMKKDERGWRDSEATVRTPRTSDFSRASVLSRASGTDATTAQADTPPSSPSSPPNVNRSDGGIHAERTRRPTCLGQTRAVLSKNLRLKYRRNFAPFVFELLSPMLIMWILVLGYQLSEITYKDASSYVSWNLDLPGPWGDIVLGVIGMGRNATGNVSAEDEFTGGAVGDGDRNADGRRGLDVPMEEEVWSTATFSGGAMRWLQSDPDVDEGDDGPNNGEDDEGSYDVFDGARKQLNSILESPIPIPTLSQYLSISSVLSSALGSTNYDEVFASSEFVRQWGNLVTLGTLHLAPSSNPVAEEFVKYLNETHNISLANEGAGESEDRTDLADGSLLVRMHSSETAALGYINDNLGERTWALIDFGPSEEEETMLVTPVNLDFHYKIRMNYTTLPNTARITDYVSVGLNRRYQRYYLSGYLTLQRTLDEFSFRRLVDIGEVKNETGRCVLPSERDLGIWAAPMPTAAHSQNEFFQAVGYLLGLTIAMAFLYPSSRLTKSLVEEKETRMKETLAIMGVGAWPHWLSGFLTAALVFLFIAVTVTSTLSSFVFKYSSPAYLFAFIGFFCSATLSFSFFVSAFFSRAKLAAIVSPMALFATLLPRWIFFGTNRYENAAGKMWASVLPCTAFAFGADILADYEYAQQGVQGYNARGGEYSFNTALGFLLLDTMLYMVLFWYFESVVPRKYGVANKWYFIFCPSYWSSAFSCCCRDLRWCWKNSNDSSNISAGANQTEFDAESPLTNFEPVSDPSLVPQVHIESLFKQFERLKPPAVNNLSLDLYESQITCLLGHNGAGKTTTISILTGLFPPTKGDCFIYGKSIARNVKEARQSIGICPQHNTLFDGLTVREHLVLFERIKGLRPTNTFVTARAEEMGLAEYVDTYACALSGGNKRKLSVAIACAGDPNFLILDEPTSAMDPYSRRATWELLRRKRSGRVTLLTTHFMDEAEILADRIAVLKKGKLQCCGSPLYLKERFGLGYNLAVVVDDNVHSSDDGNCEETGTTETSPKPQHRGRCGSATDVDDVSAEGTTTRITNFLQQFIPQTQLVRISARELVFRFPPQSEDAFPELFEAIEAVRNEFGIEGYGVSNTTLEEVFLQLADQEDSENNDQGFIDENVDTPAPLATQKQAMTSDVDLSLDRVHHERFQYMAQFPQVGLLFQKRFVTQKRDPKGAFFQIILPVLLVALVLLILMLDVTPAGPPIELSMNLYSKSSRGSKAETDVLVAGWADRFANRSASDESAVAFASIRDVFERVYPHAKLLNVSGSSSLHLSEYLLDTYNDQSHGDRFGAFVINDSINVTAAIDWEDVRHTVGKLAENFGEDVVADIGSWFGVGKEISSLPLGLTLSLLPKGEEVSNFTANTSATVLHNSTSPHAVAAFSQAYNEYLYNQCTGRASRLVSVNHPLPLTSQESIEIRTFLSVIASLLILIPYCYIPAAFIVFVVKERVSKSKHLQLVSGVDMSAYWVSTYLWDMLLYALLTFCIMVVFFLYGSESAEVFVGNAESTLCTFVMTFGYGLSALPFAYLLSRNFSNHSNAQISVMAIFFFTGFVATNAYYIMITIESTQHIAEALRPLFRMWPAYNIGDGLIALSSSFLLREIFGQDAHPFDWNVCGKPIALLYGLAAPYFIILLMLEYSHDGGSGGLFGRFLRSARSLYDRTLLRMYGTRQAPDGSISPQDDSTADATVDIEDDDVAKERAFVTENRKDLETSASVLLARLWKVYPPSMGALSATLRCLCCRHRHEADQNKSRKPRMAVKGLSVAIKSGETFGLLGVNGAGKTTTLSVLTGDVPSSSGAAFVAGHDVTGMIPGGVSQARKNIGYCPQVDPLLDLMTGRETLVMFGRLRGIPKARLHSDVDRLLESLTLTPHADKVTASYSGGNKRKLSLGISLIGNPKVLLVDEAGSGMDPSARRRMWDLILEASKHRCVLLTTHSMEEAEALCTRVGIMIDGRMRCLGSVQHLKSAFMGGYTIDVHVASNAPGDAVDKVKQRVLEDMLPGAVLSERHGRFLRFDIPSMSYSAPSLSVLGSTFQMLQQMKTDPQIMAESYSVSQCSLEQVFISLVKQSSEANSLEEAGASS